MAMPLNMENAQLVYEVPYGVSEVGKDEIAGAAGERYLTPVADIHPAVSKTGLWPAMTNLALP